MAKALSPPPSMDTTRVTVRVPVSMKNDIQIDMQASGYGRRQQSLWIEEAIKTLYQLDGFPELVVEDFIAHGTNTPIRISMNRDTERAMNQAIRRVELEEQIEDVRSKFVRTAIRHRLIASGHGI